jgi:hypothetical protein
VCTVTHSMFAESSGVGIFLSNMHSTLQSFTVSKWKLAPVIISGHLYIFWKRLYTFKALVYFQSACIFSKVLVLFLQALVFKFSKCESAPIYFSLIVSQRYHIIFSKTLFSSCLNFWMWSAQFLDHAFDYFWYFEYVSYTSINYVQNL